MDILDFFWTFYLNHLSPLWGYFLHDVQLPINHIISKTVLHLVAVGITSHKHSRHMVNVCRKFTKTFQI